MMPPAWSSLPATGLNFTSTYPSFSETSFFTHHGNVPLPDCLSTFGLLGAVASVSTVHFGVPLPVLPANQPAGSSPAFVSSKFTVSASMTGRFVFSYFIGSSSCLVLFHLHWSNFRLAFTANCQYGRENNGPAGAKLSGHAALSLRGCFSFRPLLCR